MGGRRTLQTDPAVNQFFGLVSEGIEYPPWQGLCVHMRGSGPEELLCASSSPEHGAFDPVHTRTPTRPSPLLQSSKMQMTIPDRFVRFETLSRTPVEALMSTMCNAGPVPSCVLFACSSGFWGSRL